MKPTLALGVFLSLFSWLFFDTFASMVAVWERSETFAHGYLILPIALWLMWRKKQELVSTEVKPVTWLVLPLIFACLGWYGARVIGVLVIEQLAVISILIIGLTAILGWQMVRHLAFPLGYLFFMVPIGEGLIEPMMLLTAWFVINAVELTGIPIYAEGTFFSLPSGDWSVVEGCSGVRYLIASVALGTLYAYLTYQRLSKRLLFVAVSFIVPVVANWLRAFLIVMVGHFSGMKLATGVDHLVYGWLFFGLVIFILFTLGARWRDLEADRALPIPAQQASRSSRVSFLTVSILCGALTAFPLLVYWQQSALITQQLTLPDISLDGLSSAEPSIQWTPRYINPLTDYQREFTINGHKLGVYLALYRRQGDGELINSQNVMVRQKHPVWRQLEQHHFSAPNHAVIESRLSSMTQELLTWHFNLINGHAEVNPYVGKLRELQSALLLKSPYQLGVVLYAPMLGELGPQEQEALRAALAEFNNRLEPELSRMMDELASQDSAGGRL